MNELEHAQFVFVLVDTYCEKEASVPAVDYFMIPKLHSKKS
jgi:hypothetical protein